MNVNLLQDSPDWRWYILFGCLSLVVTGVLWLISKCIPVSVLVIDHVTAGTDIHTLASDTR